MQVTDGEHDASTLIETTSYFKVLGANIHNVETVMRALLDQGENVYLDYDHNPNFVDSDTGVMSISAFEVPSSGLPLTREQRTYFGLRPSAHAVQVVGYDVDPVTNLVTKWKIKGSWGENAGDRGYYHMHRDYFLTFALRITYFDTKQAPQLKIETPQSKQMELSF
jgi:bleomycin hydrolase